MMALVAFVACTPSIPPQYIQPDEMEDILYDYHLAQAIAQQEANFQQSQIDRTKYFYAVLKKHGVSEAEFDSSMVYYYSDVPKLQKIYSGVEERIDNEAAHLGATIVERESSLNAKGDTTNVWDGKTAAVLMPIAPYNRMDFSLKVDTSYHKGDEFLMAFNTDYLYQSGTKDAVVYMAVTFDNDSTAQYYSHINSSGLSQLRVPSNFNNAIRKVCGFIFLSQGNDKSNTTKLMFIDRIRLLRYHKKEQPKPTATPQTPMTPPTTPAQGQKPDSTSAKMTHPTPKVTPPTPNGGPRQLPKPPLKPIQKNVR